MRTFALGLVLACIGFSQTESLLPPGARILDTADISKIARKPRLMVFWMQSPERVDEGDNPWCGAQVYGRIHVSGPARLSLVDPKSRKLINTVLVPKTYADGGDSITIPLEYRDDEPGAAYNMRGRSPNGEGRPAILELEDLVGNGVAADFLLTEYESCATKLRAVFGYDSRSDRVVHYQFEEHFRDKNRIEMHDWMRNISPSGTPGHLDSVVTGSWQDYHFFGKAEFDKRPPPLPILQHFCADPSARSLNDCGSMTGWLPRSSTCSRTQPMLECASSLSIARIN